MVGIGNLDRYLDSIIGAIELDGRLPVTSKIFKMKGVF
jgi:hypothetical protein